jgi:hypothetical protein
MSYVIAILRDAYTPDLQGMRSVRFYTERDDNTHPELYDTVREAQEQIDTMESVTYLLSHNECSRPEYLIVEDSTAQYILSGRDGDDDNYDWDSCDCNKRNDNGDCCGECQRCLTNMIDEDRLYIRNNAVTPQN